MFITTLHFFKTNAFVSITLPRMVAPILILPPAALWDRVGRRAPAYYVVAAAIAAQARRTLAQGVADEMFQSGADVHGAATTG